MFDVNVQDVRVTVDDEMNIPPPCTNRKRKREVSICAFKQARLTPSRVYAPTEIAREKRDRKREVSICAFKRSEMNNVKGLRTP